MRFFNEKRAGQITPTDSYLIPVAASEPHLRTSSVSPHALDHKQQPLYQPERQLKASILCRKIVINIVSSRKIIKTQNKKARGCRYNNVPLILPSVTGCSSKKAGPFSAVQMVTDGSTRGCF
jgi:hypothetical protein